MDLVNVYLTYESECGDVMIVGSVDMDQVQNPENLGEVLQAIVYGGNVDYSQAGWAYVPFDYWNRYYKGAYLKDAPFYWVSDTTPDGSLVWD